jgi:hypothetical protein
MVKRLCTVILACVELDLMPYAVSAESQAFFCNLYPPSVLLLVFLVWFMISLNDVRRGDYHRYLAEVETAPVELRRVRREALRCYQRGFAVCTQQVRFDRKRYHSLCHRVLICVYV